MRFATAMCLAAVMVPLASCSNQAQGTLDGQVRLYGGPALNGKQALNGQPGSGWQVTLSSGSQVVARTTSGASGHFTFSLAPGTYTLVCGTTQQVIVHAGTQTTVACIASVP
jgi:hypothetical protein